MSKDYSLSPESEREPLSSPPADLIPKEVKIETRRQKPIIEKEQSPKQGHAIETYTVGMPGEEKLVADTTAGHQVGVRRFEAGDVIDIEKIIIEENEAIAIQSLDGKSLDEKGVIAKGVIESSRVEAKDMAEVSKLFEGKRDMLLVVDEATIEDASVPKEGLHLLISQSELEKVKPHLQELGYLSKEIKGTGLIVEKGRSRFIFLYAKERGEKSSEKENRPNLEQVEKSLRGLEQEGKIPPEKVARYTELLSQLDDKALQLLTIFYDQQKPSNPMTGHWFMGNVAVHPEQEDRVFMHEIGHHIFDGSQKLKEFNPSYEPVLSPETITDIENMFKSLSDNEKVAVLAKKNQGWNSKPNEWFAQAFSTWINKEPGSENVDLPKYEHLKKVFESVLAKKKR